jgi:hypothetical protein
MRFPFPAATSTARCLLRTASLLAIAGLVLVSAPHPADAQGLVNSEVTNTASRTSGVLVSQPNPPAPWVSASYTLNFTRLHCAAESGEWGSDEPYVYFFVGDLKNPSASQVFRTTIFGDVDSGENRYQTVPLWSSTPIPQGDPSNLVILAQVMEHDYTNVSHVQSALQGTLRYKFNSYVQAGRSHGAIVDAMRYDMWDAILDEDDTFTLSAYSWDNLDDRVGKPLELRITTSDMQAAFAAGSVEKSLIVDGGSDGTYLTYYELRRG